MQFPMRLLLEMGIYTADRPIGVAWHGVTATLAAAVYLVELRECMGGLQVGLCGIESGSCRELGSRGERSA